MLSGEVLKNINTEGFEFINVDDTIHEYQKVLKYVQPTGSDYINIDNVSYPYNPNGSINGVTAICSDDGRHLAMMPHPERCYKMWQWPWYQKGWTNDKNYSPWFKLFLNAYEWCIQQ